MTHPSPADRMVLLCKSLFDRGYSVGGAGNVSVRLPEGGFIVTPTGSSLGRLSADELSVVDASGRPGAGPKPSKEFTFHRALYDVRPETGAIVHLHSTYLTALSCLESVPRENAIHPFTPYYVMRIGHMPVVPYYRPGSPEIGRDLAHAAQRTTAQAFLLASHGVVVLGRDVDDAVNNAEELEETAKLQFILRGERLHYLTDAEILDLGSGY
tara:strand:+ start:11760 stop:12395 length:636 start_codon:yes stop_codon:yes gene_type:complete